MRHRIAPAVVAFALTLATAPQARATRLEPPATLPPAAAARFAALALKCLHHEYPNHISHTLNSAADARPPHELTPAFYGCLDWHSDVHGHWLLVRLLRLYPDAPFAAEARAALAQSFTSANIDAEAGYLRGAGRASFERPYGLAWLLQLAAELHRWDDADARRWSATLWRATPNSHRRSSGGGGTWSNRRHATVKTCAITSSASCAATRLDTYPAIAL